MDDTNTTLSDLKAKLSAFVQERDWEQFHSPKNLSMAVAIEAAELMELFQWMTVEESWKVRSDRETMHRIREEVADVVAYCLHLCNRLSIDLASSMEDKIAQNARKYPADLVRGKARLP